MLWHKSCNVCVFVHNCGSHVCNAYMEVQQLGHMKKKKKPYFSRCGDGAANKSVGVTSTMVCDSVIKYSNVIRVREEAGRSWSGASSYQHHLNAFADSPLNHCTLVTGQ